MPRNRLRPYEQGHLDGLCGLYSIVNAIQFALLTAKLPQSYFIDRQRYLTDDDAERLFFALLAYLTQSRRPRVVIDGVGPGQIDLLLRHADRWLRRQKAVTLGSMRPLRRRGRVATKTVLEHISAHLREPGTAAIVGAVPPWQHWTVAAEVTRYRLHLFDSGGWTSVPVRLGRDRKRYHAGMIKPAHVYLVTIKHTENPALKRARE